MPPLFDTYRSASEWRSGQLYTLDRRDEDLVGEGLPSHDGDLSCLAAVYIRPAPLQSSGDAEVGFVCDECRLQLSGKRVDDHVRLFHERLYEAVGREDLLRALASVSRKVCRGDDRIEKRVVRFHFSESAATKGGLGTPRWASILGFDMHLERNPVDAVLASLTVPPASHEPLYAIVSAVEFIFDAGVHAYERLSRRVVEMFPSFSVAEHEPARGDERRSLAGLVAFLVRATNTSALLLPYQARVAVRALNRSLEPGASPSGDERTRLLTLEVLRSMFTGEWMPLTTHTAVLREPQTIFLNPFTRYIFAWTITESGEWKETGKVLSAARRMRTSLVSLVSLIVAFNNDPSYISVSICLDFMNANY